MHTPPGRWREVGEDSSGEEGEVGAALTKRRDANPHDGGIR